MDKIVRMFTIKDMSDAWINGFNNCLYHGTHFSEQAREKYLTDINITNNMKYIPTQKENPKGLHQRYAIRKILPDGTTEPRDSSSEYFVLRLDEGGKDIEHIKACRIGVNAYADAIEHHLPELSKDLKERYPLL